MRALVVYESMYGNDVARAWSSRTPTSVITPTAVR
jgi:hypothetical protein